MIQYKINKCIVIYVYLILLSLIHPLSSMAQNGVSKYTYTYEYKNAQKSFESLNYIEAISRYEKLIEKGHADVLVERNLAFAYYKTGEFVQAEQQINNLVKNKKATAVEYFLLAQILKSQERYQEADKWMKDYQKMMPQDSITGSEDLLALVNSKNKSPLYTLNLASFNSPTESDFGAILYDRGEQLVFVSARKDMMVEKKSSQDNAPYFKIFVKDVKGDKEPKLMSPKFSNGHHSGPISFNVSGNEAYLSRNVKGPKGKINLTILYSKKSKNGKWSKPEVLSFCDNEYSYTHPCWNDRKRILYFTSDRPDGQGGNDIWSVKSVGKNKWKEPQNLGPEINTPQDESFPFTNQYGILYFSSTGHTGFGGLDIFKATLQEDQSYVVENMGRPINSSSDDFSFYADKYVKNGFIASNRAVLKSETSKPVDNIYAFSFIEIDKTPINLLCTVTDSATRNNVNNVKFVFQGMTDTILIADSIHNPSKFLVEKNKEYRLIVSKEGYYSKEMMINTDSVVIKEYIINYSVQLAKIPIYGVFGTILSSDEAMPVDSVNVIFRSDNGEEISVLTDAKGAFKTKLVNNTDYNMIVSKKGYISKVYKYSTKEKKEGWINVNEYIDQVVLEVVQLGKSMVIYYAFGQSEVNEASMPELEDMIRFMVENPTLRIELGAHTDAIGSTEYNQTLSEKRAEAVTKYMIKRGIAAERIVSHGYGESQLINKGPNCSDEENQMNRRCEAKIIGL